MMLQKVDQEKKDFFIAFEDLFNQDELNKKERCIIDLCCGKKVLEEFYIAIRNKDTIFNWFQGNRCIKFFEKLKMFEDTKDKFPQRVYSVARKFLTINQARQLKNTAMQISDKK